MITASLIFAAVAVVAGLWSASYSDRLSKIEIAPFMLGWDLPRTGGHIEPVLPELRSLDVEAATIKSHQSIAEAVKETGRLNHRAALLARASAAASFISALIAAHPSLNP